MTFLPLALVNLATCHVDSPVYPSIPFDVDVDHLGQDPIPLATREYWMRRAIGALDEVVGSPCPFAAFGAVIVNHTAAAAAAAVSGDYVGEEVCIGANSVQGLGNPTLHGEIAAINNCTSILTDPAGKYKMSGAEALRALSDLSLYTTAEPCPMVRSRSSFLPSNSCACFRSSASLLEILILERTGLSTVQTAATTLARQSWF